MTPDPIVEEIHAARAAIAERFHGDLRAICADAQQRQAASPHRPIALPPRRIPPPPINKSRRAG
jgi:hypothetical protein